MHVFWISVTIIMVMLLALKIYLKLATGWNRSAICLVGKTAIVTGANTGLGFYTAQEFAKRGARVILACRNLQKAEDARTKITEATNNPDVIVRIVDLASLASVRKFAKEINETEKRLDILVNNAGAGGFDHTITADGLSLCMQINHFGPFLLTLLLIDLLKKSTPSRIVNVSSDIADLGNLNFDDLSARPESKYFSGILHYANAKLCNLLFTNELARRFKDSGVYANAVTPGAAYTSFISNLSIFPRIALTSLGTLYFKSAEEGAQTSTYAAVSKELDGIAGGYFAECRKHWKIKGAQDTSVARKLWEKSEELVRLTSDEKVA